MSVRKVCIALTARGNYAKMKSVMAEVKANPKLDLQVIVGGSLVLEKYGKIFEADIVDEVCVDHTVHFVLEGGTPLTMAKSAGLAVTEFANAFENLKPDVVVVIADRFECLAIAMAATYMNIPVAHVEGGELSGSIDESIRHAITKMAHVHFPASEEAAARIVSLGEPEDTVYNVGASSFDVMAKMNLNDLEPIREYQKSRGVGDTILVEKGKYLVVIQHPVTTEYHKNMEHANQTIQAVHELQKPTFWIWPNMDAGSDGISKAIRMYREAHHTGCIHLFKSLPIELYAPLLKNAACIIGNSSSGIREAAFLGTPTVNIGTRQQGRDRGPNVIDVPYVCEEIVAAVQKQMEHGSYEPNYLYGDGDAASKIVDTLCECRFAHQKLNTF